MVSSVLVVSFHHNTSCITPCYALCVQKRKEKRNRSQIYFPDWTIHPQLIKSKEKSLLTAFWKSTTRRSSCFPKFFKLKTMHQLRPPNLQESSCGLQIRLMQNITPLESIESFLNVHNCSPGTRLNAWWESYPVRNNHTINKALQI